MPKASIHNEYRKRRAKNKKIILKLKKLIKLIKIFKKIIDLVWS